MVMKIDSMLKLFETHWFFFCVEIGLQAVNMDVGNLEMKFANVHKQLVTLQKTNFHEYISLLNLLLLGN